MKLSLALLLAATTARTHALYVVPGSERDGWWDGCSSDGFWHCYGSGPIRKVRLVDTFLGVSVRWSGPYVWQRYDPARPERQGATVPYEEKGR